MYDIRIVDMVTSYKLAPAGNHMFMDGNKRTAVEMFKSFCSKSNITTSLTDTELMNIATQVATGQIDDVLQISQALIK